MEQAIFTMQLTQTHPAFYAEFADRFYSLIFDVANYSKGSVYQFRR